MKQEELDKILDKYEMTGAYVSDSTLRRVEYKHYDREKLTNAIKEIIEQEKADVLREFVRIYKEKRAKGPVNPDKEVEDFIKSLKEMGGKKGFD